MKPNPRQLGNLVTLLDSIGGEKFSLPSESVFFEALHRFSRDQVIRQLAENGAKKETISSHFGLSLETIDRMIYVKKKYRPKDRSKVGCVVKILPSLAERLDSYSRREKISRGAFVEKLIGDFFSSAELGLQLSSLVPELPDNQKLPSLQVLAQDWLYLPKIEIAEDISDSPA